MRVTADFNTRFQVISGLVAPWITRLPTEQKIPGPSPGKVDNVRFSTHTMIKQDNKSSNTFTEMLI